MFYLIQDSPVEHTPSLIDINLDTLPHIHGEPTRILTRHTSTVHVPTSSTILISRSQTSENILHYPLVILLILTIISDDGLSIAFRKGKHTCTPHHISHFIS